MPRKKPASKKAPAKKAPPVRRPVDPEPEVVQDLDSDDDHSTNNGNNGHATRPPIVPDTPFTVPFRWMETAAAEFQSQDGAVVMQMIQRPSGEYRLIIDAGEYAEQEGAQLVGELVMRVLADSNGLARVIRSDLADVLSLMLDNWDLIDGEKLRRIITQLVGDEPRVLRLEADVMESRDE